MMEKKPKVAARRILFESKKFRVLEKDMEFANGQIETWEVVEQKGNGGARVLRAIFSWRKTLHIREIRKENLASRIWKWFSCLWKKHSK